MKYSAPPPCTLRRAHSATDPSGAADARKKLKKLARKSIVCNNYCVARIIAVGWGRNGISLVLGGRLAMLRQRLARASAVMQLPRKGNTRMNLPPDLTFEAFKKLVRYLRGALWWGRDDLIKKVHSEFNQKDDRKGHPLLSVRKIPVESRFGVVPMLVGTSGTKMSQQERGSCVLVTGMTADDREHKTYFGSIITPGRYSFGDMLDGVRPQKGELVVKRIRKSGLRRSDETAMIVRDHWYNYKTMIPNEDKPVISDEEMKALNEWCARHGNL